MTIDDLKPGTEFFPASEWDTAPRMFRRIERPTTLPSDWKQPVMPNAADCVTGELACFSPGYPVRLPAWPHPMRR